MEPAPAIASTEQASQPTTAQQGERDKDPLQEDKAKPAKAPDDAWWRSDSSSDDGAGSAQGEPDPFYDEQLDEKDLEWADKQRSGRKTDAILACPGCFTTVCIDCQQHEQYGNQWRAIFVTNCHTDTDKPHDPSRSQGRRSKKAKAPAELYFTVVCDVCGTDVGVQDMEDELFHFFNVIPSNG